MTMTWRPDIAKTCAAPESANTCRHLGVRPSLSPNSRARANACASGSPSSPMPRRLATSALAQRRSFLIPPCAGATHSIDAPRPFTQSLRRLPTSSSRSLSSHPVQRHVSSAFGASRLFPIWPTTENAIGELSTLKLAHRLPFSSTATAASRSTRAQTENGRPALTSSASSRTRLRQSAT